jgi:hypothetical protein
MRLRTIIGLLFLFLWSAVAVSSQDANDTARSLYKVANYAVQVAKPGLAASNNITWEILRVTRLSNMTCPLVEGTDLGREVRPYIMTLHYGNERYVVYVAEDGTLAQPCDSKFDTLAAVIPPTPTPWPTATAFTPTITLTPGPTATPLSAAFICPPDFTGFMAPRIKLGLATARVGDGGSPNRLRDQPSVSGEQIGQIQPGRTINQVLSGPACSETYVWWLVETDGIQGWTVESDSSDGGSYFLEPLEGFAFPTSIPTEVAAIFSTAAAPGLLQMMTLRVSGSVQELRFLSEDTLVVQGAFGELYVWTVTGDSEISLQTVKNVVAFDDTEDALYGLVRGEHQLVTAKKASLTDITTLPIEGLNGANGMSMTRDGSYFLMGGCNDMHCTQGKIDLWETASGTLLRSQPAHTYVPNAWFTPDDTRILSMSRDGFQVWDTQSGTFLGGVALTISPDPLSVRPIISPDSAYYYMLTCTELLVSVVCGNGKIQFRGWSIETSEQVTIS